MMLVSIEDTCFVTGEWLNGRVAVSKTVGCVFESRLPCHRFPTTTSCGRELLLTQYIDKFPNVAPKLP